MQTLCLIARLVQRLELPHSEEDRLRTFYASVLAAQGAREIRD